MQERRATTAAAASTQGRVLGPMSRRESPHGMEEISVALPRARRVHFAPGIISLRCQHL